jgi:hypothetical protein
MHISLQVRFIDNKKKQNAPLRAYATKAWPYYRRMQAFMPGTQPRGTHAFDPAGSSSQSATHILDVVNAEEDGAEDQVGPLSSESMANMPAVPTSTVSPLVSMFSCYSTNSFLYFQPVLPNLGSSFISSLSPSDPSASSSSSARPPPSSSPLPPVHPHLSQQRNLNISMGSVTTSSEASSSQLRKRKHDARSSSGMQPPSSKRASRNKTDDINPVVMANALNSTINRMVDMMARTFDAPASTTFPPPSIVTSPLDFINHPLSSAPSQPLSTSGSSSTEILDQAVKIISANDGSLTEDELFAASLFFTSASEDAIRTARTFISLGDNNQSVKYRFLLRQLDTAGLLPGRGKAKAVEEEDDDLSMMY